MADTETGSPFSIPHVATSVPAEPDTAVAGAATGDTRAGLPWGRALKVGFVTGLVYSALSTISVIGRAAAFVQLSEAEMVNATRLFLGAAVITVPVGIALAALILRAYPSGEDGWSASCRRLDSTCWGSWRSCYWWPSVQPRTSSEDRCVGVAAASVRARHGGSNRVQQAHTREATTCAPTSMAAGGPHRATGEPDPLRFGGPSECVQDGSY
jgi:hypothetical protein